MITKDKIADPTEPEGGYLNAKGLVGPRGASDADKARLEAGEGVKFRLLDDDGEVYYYGRRLEESDADDTYYGENELAPLTDFGAPNAGCTEQQEKNKDGVWESIN